MDLVARFSENMFAKCSAMGVEEWANGSAVQGIVDADASLRRNVKGTKWRQLNISVVLRCYMFFEAHRPIEMGTVTISA